MPIVDELEKGQSVQEASIKLMEHLIQDLLDYAQIKSGKFRMNLTNFNIKKSILDVLLILEEKAIAKDIIVEHDFENLSFDTMHHDEKRIQQVLLNLHSNAIKFTETGMVTITVSNDDEFLQIAVKDSGSGIT